MNLKKRLILVFVISCTVVTSQNIINKVKYEVVAIDNKDKKKLSDTFESKKVKAFFSKSAFFTLLFNKTSSVYKLKDDAMKIDNGRGEKLGFLEIAGGSKGVYYTSQEKKEILQEKEVYGEGLLISYKLPVWKITKQTKKIGDFLCYKAVSLSEKGTVAWFTTKIPFSFGPKTYSGLPGLILEVNFGNLKIKATKVLLNSKTDKTLLKPKKTKKVTEKEYYKKLKDMGKSIGF